MCVYLNIKEEGKKQTSTDGVKHNNSIKQFTAIYYFNLSMDKVGWATMKLLGLQREAEV